MKSFNIIFLWFRHLVEGNEEGEGQGEGEGEGEERHQHFYALSTDKRITNGIIAAFKIIRAGFIEFVHTYERASVRCHILYWAGHDYYIFEVIKLFEVEQKLL